MNHSASKRSFIEKWFRYGAVLKREFIRRNTLEVLPIRTAVKGYSLEKAKADAKAGFNVALLAFPQSIAYAAIAGLPIEYGLYATVVASIIGPIFTRSRFIALGPTNATAVMLFSVFMTMGMSETDKITAMPLFLSLVGFFLLLGAIFNLSVFLNYVSRTVVTGYVTAAAALIIANQSQHALGLKVPDGTSFFGLIWETIIRLPQTVPHELLVALITFLVYRSLQKVFPKLPNVVVTLAIMGVFAFGLDQLMQHFALSESVAKLKGYSFSEYQFHTFSFDMKLVGQLAGAAMAVAFLSILEGSSIGKSMASRSGERININQEMYSMGLANIACAFTGSMNASGSLTRSALNVTSGAMTSLSSIYSGIVVLGMLAAVGGYISYIPKASLAVVVICIAISLFSRRAINVAFKTTRSDASVFLVTCIGALVFPLNIAIYLGAFTSIILFLRKAGTPELVEYSFNKEGQLAELPEAGKRDTPGISILHAEGDLFFGSTDIFVEQTRQVIRDPNLKIIILRLKNAHHLDATCVLAIEELMTFLRTRELHLIVSGAHPEVFRVFRNSGLLDKLGRENFFPEVPGNPNVSTRHALKRAQSLIGTKSAEIRIFVDAQRQARERQQAEKNSESPPP